MPENRAAGGRSHLGALSDERPLDQALIDVKAAELRGKRMTYAQIAREMGCSPSTAFERVQRVYQATRVETAETARQFERERLDGLWQKAEAIASTVHYVVAHGKVVKDDDGNPVIDDGPVLAARREQRAIAESYRKLDGLDAPTKVEQSGAVTYEVVGIDPSDLA